MNAASVLAPDRYQRILRRSIVLPILASLLISSLLYFQIQKLMSLTRWLDHADQVIGEAYEFQNLVIDAETGVRGYRAYNDRRFLEHYNKALQSIPPQFEHLVAMVSDSPSQETQLAELKERVKHRLDLLQDVIARIDAHSPPKAARGFLGKASMDEIRMQINAFISVENQLRTQRKFSVQSSSRMMTGMLAGVSILLGLLFWMTTRRALALLSDTYREAIQNLSQKTQQLYESREWFATTLKSIGDAVIVVTPDSKIEFMNPIAEQLTGWKLPEAKGQSMEQVFQIVNEETRKPAFNPVGKVLKEGVIVGLANHTALISRDSTERPIEDSAAPIRDETGETQGVVLVFRDVTDRHTATRKLEMMTSDLQQAVQYRDNFLSVASHELKTPLTALKLQLQMAQMKLASPSALAPSPENSRKMLDLSMGQIKRLNQLVDDLLDVSRIRAGKLSYDFETIDLDQLVRKGIQDFIDQFKITKIFFQAKTDAPEMNEPVLIHGDSFRLEQVLSNLLTNAVKYGGDQPIHVRIDRDGDFVVLSVVDRGIGVPKEKHGLIFERFERAVSSSNISGLGLGLFIVKQIVEAHGGTVLVESEPDQGSSFMVRLPMNKGKK